MLFGVELFSTAEEKVTMEQGKTILIVSTSIVLLVLVIFSGLANIGTINGIEGSSSIFPQSFEFVANKYKIEISPSPQIFGIWGFIYVYQLAWVFYTVSLVFRRGAADILPAAFYALFILSSILSIVWLFLWSREVLGLGFAVIALVGISLHGSVYLAFSAFSTYLQSFPRADDSPSALDIWCIRLLVINGLVFYTSWISFESLLGFTTVLEHVLLASAGAAATTSLTLLVLGIIVWFALENFAFEVATRFCFAEYIPLIVGLSGVIKNNWVNGDGNQGYALFVLIVAVLLLVSRLAVIFVKERKRGSLVCTQQQTGENVKLV